MKLIISIFLFFLLPSFASQAQDLLFNIQYFNEEDGLSDRSVFCVNQDDRGFVWAGTGNGLNRFDGHRFQKVNTLMPELSSGEIRSIRKVNGKFWIHRLYDTIRLFDPYLEKELDLPFCDTLQYGKLTPVVKRGDTNDRLYFVNNKKQIFYLNENGWIVPKRPLSEHDFYPVHSKHSSLELRVNDTKDTVIFFFNNAGFSTHLQVLSDKVSYKLHSTHQEVKVNNPVVQIKKGTSGEKVVLKKNGNPFSFKEIQTPSHNSSIIRLIPDSEGNIWLVGSSRVLFFNSNGDLQKDLSEKVLELTKIRWAPDDIFIDQHDNLWVSTGLGILLIKQQNNPFKNFLNGDYTSIRDIISVDDSLLLVGTYKGSKLINKFTKRVVKEFLQYFVGFSRNDNQTVWCGMHGNNIYKFNTLDYTVTSYIFKANEKADYQVPYFDTVTRRLYVGTARGIYFKDLDGYLKPFNQVNEYTDFSFQKVNHFYRNKEGLWVGTSNGLYLIDDEKGIVDHVRFTKSIIKHFYEDDQGIFWIATGGEGLIRWHRSKNEIKTFTTEQGLSNNVIYAVYEDKKGYLWLPSNNGLIRFEKATSEVAYFLPEDGIPNKEFNTYSHFQDRDGRLYFGGLDGFIAFYPEEVKIIPNQAPFVLSRIMVFDGKIDDLLDKTTNWLTQQSLTIHPSDNFFTLEFALLDYADRKHIYGWKIEGQDKNWNFQTENTLRINRLPYGQHDLIIKAKGTGGQWAVNQLTIPITVLKPFYLQPLFLVALMVVFLLIVYLVVRKRLRLLQRSKENLEQQVAERTRELSQKNEELKVVNELKDKLFAIIGHDLRGPLSSLHGLTKQVNFLIKKNRIEDIQKLGEQVENATTGVTKLLDNLLDWALLQKEAFPHHPEWIELSIIVNDILTIYRPMAETKNTQMVHSLPKGIKVFADKHALATIVRNLIDNALKFSGNNGVIELKAFKKNNAVIIEVIDDGIGISTGNLKNIFDLNGERTKNGTNGEKGVGLGLLLCKELVDKHQGKISVSSKENEGSTFRVELPLDFPN